MAAGYRGPSIDHGLLSPSGKASKRARTYLMAEHQARVEAWWAEKYPAPSAEEALAAKNAERKASLLRSAANLDDLAERGMHPRKYRKEAARLRAEAATL